MLLKVMPALPLSQRARSKSGGTLIWGAIFFFLSADYSGLGYPEPGRLRAVAGASEAGGEIARLTCPMRAISTLASSPEA